jgi:hypothetical protein
VTPDPPSTEAGEDGGVPPTLTSPTPASGDYHPTGEVPPAPTGIVSSAPQRAAAIANDRPEAAVGAAFAGGFLLALILKRLVR